MKKKTVCTIVAKNYLAYARTLFDSLRAVDTDCDFHLLIVDNFERGYERDYLAGIAVVSPLDFLPYETYFGMAFAYDVTELSTALKPFLLEYLLRLGYESVLYFDPDIYVFKPIGEILDALAANTIVLTPHLLEPIPQDGKNPDEITIMQSGAFNCGFIAVSDSAEARRFVGWWSDRLRTLCVNRHQEGLFVDQKWIDLVPGMFSGVGILKNRGFNVAYWNLHSRPISADSMCRLASGEPLVFFHYSGFNPSRPTELSRHQNRINPKAHPRLLELLQFYAGAVAKNKHDHFRKVPYGFATFSNGAVVDRTTRAICREALIAGISFADPFDAGAPESLFAHINAPAANDGGRPRMTNYLHSFWRSRPDLRGIFSDPFGAHRSAFFEWLEIDKMHGIDPVYIAEAKHVDGVRSVAPDLGINIAGYFRAEMGVGETSRGHAAAAHAAGIPSALIDFSDAAVHRKEEGAQLSYALEPRYAVNLVHVNADQIPRFARELGSSFFARRYNASFWAWELPEFPKEWEPSFDYFDEIWVGSEFVRATLMKCSPIPVFRIPPVVDRKSVPPAGKPHFGLSDDEFTFLFMFDFLSVFERKNPLELIAAFQSAFTNGERVRLVLKYNNPEFDAPNAQRLEDAVRRDPRITRVDGYLSALEKDQLMEACDAYVSLHRSEGTGLTMAEAMTLGKPVAATWWSGNVDFMSAANSYPVPYRLVTLDRDFGPYHAGQIWAQPDVASAGRLMKQIYDRPEEAKGRGVRAIQDMDAAMSSRAVGALMTARLREIVRDCPWLRVENSGAMNRFERLQGALV